MNLTSQRYKIAPQLKDYDSLPTDWKPYTMFRQASNFSSESVNTDEIGQRFNFDKNGNRLSFSDLEGPFDLIVGASTAFCIGATHDKNTIASRLSTLSGRQTLSLTGRAYNSRQELLLFVEHLHKFSSLEKVIIISGANNLYVSAFHDKYGIPFFWSDAFYDSIRRASLSQKKRFLSLFFDTIYGKHIDWSAVNKTNIFQKIYEGYRYQFSTKRTPLVDVKRAAHRTIEDLNIFQKLTESIGAKLTFYLQPIAGWMQKPLVHEEKMLIESVKPKTFDIIQAFSDPEIHSEYASIIADFCTSAELSFSDLNSCVNPKNCWMFVDRVHLTDAGNSLVAEYIFNHLYR